MAGPLANSQTAKPIGNRHRASRCAAAPTSTTTQNGCSPKSTKRTNPGQRNGRPGGRRNCRRPTRYR
jgi:hypothetical protein